MGGAGHIADPYHAIQVPVLVFRVPIDVQGQLVRTQRGPGQARADTVVAPDPLQNQQTLPTTLSDMVPPPEVRSRCHLGLT